MTLFLLFITALILMINAAVGGGFIIASLFHISMITGICINLVIFICIIVIISYLIETKIN